MTPKKNPLADLEAAQFAPLGPTLTLRPAEVPAEPALVVRPTPAVGLILRRIQYAVQTRSPLCIVTGVHGSGKSTAASVYAEQNSRALHWEARPEYNSREIVADLCEHLGIRAGEA